MGRECGGRDSAKKLLRRVLALLVALNSACTCSSVCRTEPNPDGSEVKRELSRTLLIPSFP